ncbi:MAG: hypothetical protein E7635_05515 [Ruminococcaceae bacterium]|nr:hypothetical protein [Oscillospiraceae bacterium]
MNLKKRISDVILNLIITVLILSMLTLTVLFAVRSISQGEDNNRTFDKLWIVQDVEETAFSVFDISFCTPELIVYKQPGETPRASVYDSALTATLYSVLSDAVLDVFSSQSVCISKGIDYTSAVNEVLSADSFILFEYSNALPYPYIYALTSAQSSADISMCAQGSGESILTLVLLLSKNESSETVYRCYGFDDQNNAYSFEKKDRTLYKLQASDKIYIDAYSYSLQTIDFISKDGNTFKTPSLDIANPSFSYFPLDVSADINMLKLNSEDSAQAFFKLFEINPEKVNAYVEKDGSTVFIKPGERLSVSSDNTIEYTSETGSIPMKKILGYVPGQSGSFTLFDMLKATNVFISKVRTSYPELMGKGADIRLTGVYKSVQDNSDLIKPVFEYSYFYNGIRVDTKPAFYFVFNSEGICELKINISGFVPVSGKSVALPKITVYNRLKNSLESTTLLRPVYSKDKTGLYHIKWASFK